MKDIKSLFKNRLVIAIIIVIIIAGMAIVFNNKPVKTTPKKPAPVTLVNYTLAKEELKFSYPSNWKLQIVTFKSATPGTYSSVDLTVPGTKFSMVITAVNTGTGPSGNSALEIVKAVPITYVGSPYYLDYLGGNVTNPSNHITTTEVEDLFLSSSSTDYTQTPPTVNFRADSQTPGYITVNVTDSGVILSLDEALANPYFNTAKTVIESMHY